MLGKSAQVNYLTDTLKFVFYTGTDGLSHEFVSGLTGTIVARSGALSGVTLTNGDVDANDITVTAVTGSAFTHVLLIKDTGSDATSPVLADYGAAYTPNGGDITVVVNASGLFTI